jgi:hypothetical protein
MLHVRRCIDHASDLQRVQLVNEITYNTLTLVQDPYGNYMRCFAPNPYPFRTNIFAILGCPIYS